ncbi:uncharacterized protein LOC142337013 isoform X2 [Convolutriloba macropyga]|uniref:uncharacterized protein LOC142337013 isoform X2 n=1 Tax=Convolutriloba macropyga TaxID=536237 RepID=UPI003F51DB4A
MATGVFRRPEVVILLLIGTRLSWAAFTITQSHQSSNATGIKVCVRLDNPPGRLYRDNIPVASNLQNDDCVFDNGYNNNVPGDGLEPSRQFEYALVDDNDNTIRDKFCTYAGEVYCSCTDFNPDNRFTNYTYFLVNYHECVQKNKNETQESEKVFANTIRSGPNGVSLALDSYAAYWVKLTITFEDRDWSLDYIMYRDGIQIANFTYPDYHGSSAIWSDEGVNAATKYHYRIEEQDRINGLSSSSDIVEVCTNPPAPQSVDYTIDTETMQAEIAWVMPSGVYGQQMIFEVTTDKENKQPLHKPTSSPFLWPEALVFTTQYEFHVRLFINCDAGSNTGKLYSPWTSVSVTANEPKLTLSQSDETTVVINFDSYQQYTEISLFVDGDEHFPSSYPQTITGLNPGQTYSFFVRAEQFGKTTQSPPIEITMPGGNGSDSSRATTVGLIVTGVVLLFFIVLVVAAIIWTRRTQQKEPVPPSTSTIAASTSQPEGATGQTGGKPGNPIINIAIVTPPDKCPSYINKHEYSSKVYDSICPIVYSNYRDPYASDQTQSQSRTGTINLRNYQVSTSGELVAESVMLNEYGQSLNDQEPQTD